MKEFNNSIAFILFLIYLVGSIGILVAGFYYPDCPFYIKTEKDDFSSNLNINLTININQIGNYKEENFKNSTYFDKYKQAKLRQNEEENSNITKELNLGIYINFLTIYLSMYLCVSFFVKENDCPDCDCSKFFENLEEHNKLLFYICFPCYGCYLFSLCCLNSIRKICSYCQCCDDCDCDCGWDDHCEGCECRGEGEALAGAALFICALLVAVVVIAGFFYLIYFLANLCGKNITRYVSIIIISITNIIILILAYSAVDEKENSVYVVLGFSGLIIISNIIAIISNNYCCDSNYSPIKEYKYEPTNRTNKVTPTPKDLDYNLEAEANRDPNNQTPSNGDKNPMIEYQTYSSNDNIGKTAY